MAEISPEARALPLDTLSIDTQIFSTKNKTKQNKTEVHSKQETRLNIL